MVLTGQKPLVLSRWASALIAKMDAPASGNTLNQALLSGLNTAMDQLEGDPTIRVMVIRGGDGVFCEGMDFTEASQTPASDIGAQHGEGDVQVRDRLAPFWELLARMTHCPKPIVSLVEGRVSAGGLGLVAAADLAIATPASTFLISELLFGLLPASIAPFLIRRIGWQNAWRLTLTARRIDAEEALRMNLLDEVTDVPDDALRRFLLRIDRMDPAAVASAKSYFHKLNPISAGQGVVALDALSERLSDPSVSQGIEHFMSGGGLPWQK